MCVRSYQKLVLPTPTLMIVTTTSVAFTASEVGVELQHGAARRLDGGTHLGGQGGRHDQGLVRAIAREHECW